VVQCAMIGAADGNYPSGKGGSSPSCSSFRRSLAALVFANVAIAIAAAPGAVAVAWALTRSPLGFPITCCCAYALLELVGFCMELSWSGAKSRYFWAVAIPMCMAQIAMTLLVTRHRKADGFLVAALCLGLRETIFEGFFAGVGVAGRGFQERSASSALGGFLYGCVLALLVWGACFTLHATQGRMSALSPNLLVVLYALVLPFFRCFAKLGLVQSTAVTVRALRHTSQVQQGDIDSSRQASSGGHILDCAPHDALVLRADAALVLSVFLDLPYVFVLLMLPERSAFLMCVAAIAIADTALVFHLEAFQARRAKAQQAESLALTRGQGSANEFWSPSYSLDRPVSAVATLLSGDSADAPHRVTMGHPAALEAAAPSRSGELHSAGARTSYGATMSETTSAPSAAPPAATPDAVGGQMLMSPRVSRLLDEFDSAVVDRQRFRVGAANSSTLVCGLEVCALQELKWMTTSFSLGSMVSLVSAICIACIVNRRLLWFDPYTLMVRIAALVGARIVADMAMCFVVGRSLGFAGGGVETWDGHFEFASRKGWLLRMSAVAAATAVVIVGLR